MTSSFQREKMSLGLADIMGPLIEKHYHEIAHYQDIPLRPNWELYIALEDQGILRVYTVRSPDWSLIGYAIFMVKENIHYATSRQAAQDVLFLEKSERKNGVGRDFIAWCDEQLRLDGVQLVVQHLKAKANFGPKILEPLGYELIDLVYGRRLDK